VVQDFFHPQYDQPETGAIPKILRLMSHFAERHGSKMTATNIELTHLEAAWRRWPRSFRYRDQLLPSMDWGKSTGNHESLTATSLASFIQV
jgi:hypothetical protein